MDGTNSVKKNMLFNTVGSLVYYVCQWLPTVLIVRLSGYSDAGILSIAMSVTAAPAIIGLFNMRSYQVSDIQEVYNNDAYIKSRTVTNVLSFFVCTIMVFINGYSWYKTIAILFYMLYKISEGYADVYYGIEQKHARLDYTGISLIIRGIGTISAFLVAYILSKDMICAIVAMTLASTLVVLLFDYPITRKMEKGELKEKASWKQISSLMITCVPLAVVAFLNNLSINIPKIFLENYYGEEIMGVYSSVASPTVVIQLAATTVFAPLIPILTMQYMNKNKKEFLQTVKRFFLLVIILSVICLVGSKLLARWGLVLLFSSSIEPYVDLFIPVVWVSIFIALNACMFSVCTLMRIMKPQYLIGVVGVLSSWILSITAVRQFSMDGVIYALLGTLILQILIQLGMIVYKIRRM